MTDNYKYFTDYLACPYTKKNLELVEDNGLPTLVSGDNKYLIQNGTPLLISKRNYNDSRDEKFIRSIENFWNSGWEKRSEEDDHSFLYKLNEKEMLKRLTARYELQRSRGEGIGDYLSNEIKLDMLKDKTSIVIGPGCGEEAMELSFICKTKVIGIDISLKSASLTNSLLNKFGHKSGIGIQGDSRFLPIQSNSVDFVFSSGVIHHSPNIQKSVDEILRVLKPGGKFCVGLYHKNSIGWRKFLLKGLIKGNWTRKTLGQHISSQTEVSWITDEQRNPHTELFSRSECSKLFNNFERTHIRSGNFHTPGNLILKFLSLVENTKLMSRFGTMIYVSGSKT
tara:strand:+ start:110 stop:1123 length:1014 start_codon:yes stop_codon:yes gene_type:complete